jgi:hypothetical protein
LAQQIKLVLVEAVLQSEQQQIIAVSGRVNGLLIDQHGVDDATHLDQLLPVPAIARKARDFTGAHGPDLAQADFGDHPFEAGPQRSSSITSILPPAQRHQTIPHGILQGATLTVVQNLVSRRLAHIEQRLTLQMMGENLLRGHDWPPLLRSAASDRRAPESIVSSDRSARFLPRPEGQTMSVYPRPTGAGSRRTGRTAAARRAGRSMPSFGVSSGCWLNTDLSHILVARGP